MIWQDCRPLTRTFAQLEKERLSAATRYREAARFLSDKRRAAAEILEKTVAKELAQLAMQHCRFQVAFAEAASQIPARTMASLRRGKRLWGSIRLNSC